MKASKNCAKKDALGSNIERLLISNLEPSSLSGGVLACMRARLMRRVRQTSNLPSEFITVRNVDGEWTEIMTGVFQKKLVDNGKLHASLYRLLPGSSFPAHDHPSDEECICLQGEVNLGGTVIKAGEFHLAPRGLPHGKVTTKEGCLLYVRCAADCAI